MSKELEDLRADFSKVATIDQLYAFERRYGLNSAEIKQSDSPQTLSIVGALVDGVEVRVTHRWYDPSGAFQNLPDMNKVNLEINGVKVLEIAFPN